MAGLGKSLIKRGLVGHTRLPWLQGSANVFILDESSEMHSLIVTRECVRVSVESSRVGKSHCDGLNASQHATMHCNGLQCTATHEAGCVWDSASWLESDVPSCRHASLLRLSWREETEMEIGKYCNALQHTAAHCSTLATHLQHIATHCDTLQTHCNTNPMSSNCCKHGITTKCRL